MSSTQGPLGSELEESRTAPRFGEHTPLSEKLLAVAIRAQNFTGSSGVAIALTEGDGMICRANWGTSAPEVGAQLSIEHSFTGLCVRTGEPIRCDDAENDPRVNAEACRALGISAIAAAPVRRGSKVIGVIAAFSDTPNAFKEKHLTILGTLADVVVEILDDPLPVQPLPQREEAVPEEPARSAVIATESEQVALLSLPVMPMGEPEKVETAASASKRPSPFKLPTPAPEPAMEPFRMEGWVKPTPSVPPPAAPMPVPRVQAGSASLSSAPVFEREKTESPAARFERRKSDQPKEDKPQVLPAAADLGPRAVPVMARFSSRVAPRITPEAERDLTPVFAKVGDEPVSNRRWLLPAAVFAAFAVLAAAGWRLHASRSAAPAKVTQLASAPVASSQEAGFPSLPQNEASVDSKPTTSTETTPTPFSPPPMATMVPTRAGTTSPARASGPPARGTARVSEAPPDVTIRHAPQAVVEAAGPVRQPKSAGVMRTPDSQAAEAPKLVLASPASLPNLAAPASSVAGPTSHVVPAKLLHRVEPAYPDLARRMQLSARVVMSATIAKDGSVSDVRWVSGNEVFRNNSVAAVKQWRYKPANLNGQPVASEVDVVLQYTPPRR